MINKMEITKEKLLNMKNDVREINELDLSNIEKKIVRQYFILITNLINNSNIPYN